MRLVMVYRKLKSVRHQPSRVKQRLELQKLNPGTVRQLKFDLISQTVKNATKPRITRRKPFFDKVSNIVGYPKQVNYDAHNNNKKERKVQFRNDLI